MSDKLKYDNNYSFWVTKKMRLDKNNGTFTCLDNAIMIRPCLPATRNF